LVGLRSAGRGAAFLSLLEGDPAVLEVHFEIARSLNQSSLVIVGYIHPFKALHQQNSIRLHNLRND